MALGRKKQLLERCVSSGRNGLVGVNFFFDILESVPMRNVEIAMSVALPCEMQILSSLLANVSDRHVTR